MERERERERGEYYQTKEQTIINYSKPLKSATYTKHGIFQYVAGTWGRDWLPTRSPLAGATFMNEFVPNAMFTRQRLTVILTKLK